MISSSPIQQLSDILERFRRGGDDIEIVRWLHAMAPQIAGLPKPAVHAAGRGYTRSLLHRSEAFEIVAIHWDRGCVTPIHDHGGARCWLAVCGGEMHIENYVRLDSGGTEGYARIAIEGREELGIGGVDYRQDDVHLHRCVTPNRNTTSLHVYAHPIENFYTFDERAQTCAVVSSTYDALPA